MSNDATDGSPIKKPVTVAGGQLPSGGSHADRIDDDGGRPAKWRIVGPGLVVAATGVGAADMVATLVAGSRYGYGLFWAVIVGVVLKIILVEGAGRYTLATGKTTFENAVCACVPACPFNIPQTKGRRPPDIDHDHEARVLKTLKKKSGEFWGTGQARHREQPLLQALPRTFSGSDNG